MIVLMLIVALALSILVAPRASDAQQPAHIPKVGWLDWGGRPDKAHLHAAFLQGLASWAMWRGRTSSWHAVMRRASSTSCPRSRLSWSGSRLTSS